MDVLLTRVIYRCSPDYPFTHLFSTHLPLTYTSCAYHPFCFLIIFFQSPQSIQTSNIFALGTITDPNIGELVSAVSTMLHCQMMRDAEASEKKKKMLPFFCEEYYTNKLNKEVS
jgi:hypothetical protein